MSSYREGTQEERGCQTHLPNHRGTTFEEDLEEENRIQSIGMRGIQGWSKGGFILPWVSVVWGGALLLLGWGT